MLWLAQEVTMDQPHAPPSFWQTPFGVVAAIVALAASVYLWMAHHDHLLALLPLALLGVCPLVHILWHRSLGGPAPDEAGHGDGIRHG
jgi:hypothetical protein